MIRTTVCETRIQDNRWRVTEAISSRSGQWNVMKHVGATKYFWAEITNLEPSQNPTQSIHQSATSQSLVQIDWFFLDGYIFLLCLDGYRGVERIPACWSLLLVILRATRLNFSHIVGSNQSHCVSGSKPLTPVRTWMYTAQWPLGYTGQKLRDPSTVLCQVFTDIALATDKFIGRYFTWYKHVWGANFHSLTSQPASLKLCRNRAVYYYDFRGDLIFPRLSTLTSWYYEQQGWILVI